MEPSTDYPEKLRLLQVDVGGMPFYLIINQRISLGNALHCSTGMAFDSAIEHIMRNVNYGW